ncbi:phosphohistidine phosphatase SixA [Aeropyrum pernix]|uniref:Phosphohistidine phosphatase SixA n=1 Tax=Aeropyrum pernix TaxID=56636 RepID=A0A401H7S5_AERPX|nr:histidine phosphatase family protein [Aeropyrum pernix]GBF08516.1 phosphohistidine phosphatase SixA [Aeropyrum pernix]
MTLIVFFRHGKAEPKMPGVDDRERRLTEEGAADVECAARLLRGMGVVRILTSPYRRAIQTAEILARTLDLEYSVVEWLAPDSDVSVEDLPRLGVGDGYVLVGHNPWMEDTVTELAGGFLELKAGGFAVVEVESFKAGGGKLLSLVNPGVISICQR